MKKSSCMRLFVICLSLMLSISMMPFGVFADAVEDSTDQSQVVTEIPEDASGETADPSGPGQPADPGTGDNDAVTVPEEGTDNVQSDTDASVTDDPATPEETGVAEETEDIDGDQAPEETQVVFEGKLEKQDENDETPELKVIVTAGEDAFPAGTTMKVEAADLDETRDQMIDELGKIIIPAAAVDITFYDAEGAEVEPASPVQVQFEADFIEKDKEAVVVHIDDEGKCEEKEVAEQEDSSLVIEAEAFSVYAVGYTVDFAFNGLQYSIEGKSSVKLSTILEKLETGLDTELIKDVKFSDETLVKVEKDAVDGQPAESNEQPAESTDQLAESNEQPAESNEQPAESEGQTEGQAQGQPKPDWTLTSLQPFNTKETLTITLKDDSTVEIAVTDARTGTSGTVKWTIDDAGNMLFEPTSGNEGTFGPITSANSQPWADYKDEIKTISFKEGTTIYACGGNNEADECQYLFAGLKNLTTFNAEGFDTSKATSMHRWFLECSSLTSLDLSNFDFSKVTKMQYMLAYCYELKEVKFPDDADCGKVKYARNLFTSCYNLTEIDMSGMKFSESLQYPASMFISCRNLKTLDISGLNTRKAQYFSDFFHDCGIEEITIGSDFRFIKASTGFPRGVWKYSGDGNTYTAPEIVEKLKTKSMPGTFTKVMDRALPVTFGVDYRVGQLTSVDFKTDPEGEEVYKFDQEGVYGQSVYMPVDGSKADSNGDYRPPGSFTLTFPDSVEDPDGNKYALQMTFSDIVLHQASEIIMDEAHDNEHYTNYFHRFFRLGDHNPCLMGEDRHTKDDDVDPKYSTTSEYKITLKIVDENGNAVPGHFMFSIYDLDIPDPLDYGQPGTRERIENKTELPYRSYGWYSEGVYLREGFDTDTITVAENTYTWLGGPQGVQPPIEGYRITGTQIDGSSELTDVVVRADAEGSEFVWTGFSCEDFFLHRYQPEPVYFNKVDQYGNRVSGAKLELYQIADSSGTAIEPRVQIATWTSDKTKAHDYSDYLPPGKYRLTETEVPTGYAQAEDVTFIIDNDFDVCDENGKKIDGLYDDDGNRIAAMNIVSMSDELYEAEGEVKVKKTLTGRDWTTDDSFEFTITPVGDAPAFTPNTVTVTKNDPDYTKSFGKVKFTEPGTYEWKISETHKGETIDGITYDDEDKTVTIRVIRNSEGKLIPARGYSLVWTAEFENTYQLEPCQGEVKVQKTLNGRPWTTDDSFEFTITPIGDAPEFTPNKVTIVKGALTKSFGKVTFTAPGTYQWTVTETHSGETIDGIRYEKDPKIVTIKVVDDGTGKLVADTGSALIQIAKFTNTYKADSCEGEVKVKKTLTGKDWTEDDSFEFTITPVGDAPAFSPTTITVTKDDPDYTKSFGTVTFTKAGTYQWTVSETHKGETVDGISYDNEDKTVTIVVKDDGKGKLVAETGSALVQTAEFENTYSKSGEGEVKVKKNLSGRDWTTDDSFEFTITPEGDAPAFSPNKVTITKSDKNYMKSFGTVTFTEAGTYKWTVSETHGGETIDGVKYAEDKTVTITVVDDGSGNLVAGTGSALVQTVTLTNTYKLEPCQGEVKAKKLLNGRPWTTDDSFEFTITPIGDAPAFSQPTVTVTNKDTDYTKSFGTVTFAKAGTYEWTVSETHSGETVDGLAYDSADKTVTIVVKDDGKGHLVPDTGTELVQTAEFENTYTKSGIGEVKVRKNLTGRAWTADDSFEFTITPVGTAPAFTKDKVTITKDDANYTESFGTVTFTEPGTYQWTVSETHKGETIDGVKYAATDQTVTIKVKDDGKGNLVADTGSALVQTKTFKNTYSKSGEGEVKVKKNLSGRDWTTDDSFEFTITPVGTAPAFSPNKVTVTNADADYTKSFGTVTFTEAGTYQWKISETHKGETVDGVKYADADQTVTIVVKDDGKGNLVADTGSALVQTGTFDNEYCPKGEGEVKVKKILNGREWTSDDSFEFTISPVGDAPAFSPTTITVTKDDPDYTKSFGKVTFTKAGTYQWTVSETHKGETIDGIAYAAEDQTVTIKVRDDGKGKLVADTGSAVVQTAEFENTYSAKGTGEILVQKVLEGREWTDDDEFTFSLSTENRAPMPENEEITITKADADQTKSFGTFELTKAGTYIYTVKETKGTLGGVTYDETEHTVTIEAIDDGKGNIVAADGSALIQTEKITNTYAASGEGEILVQKILDGRPWTKDDKFTFSISAEDGTPMPENKEITITKSDKDQTKSFGTIKFTQGGEYTYTLKETKGTLGGVTYDETDHVVTIKVKDNGQGEIVSDGTPLVQVEQFNNPYKASPAKGEIIVQKILDGRKWTTDDEFEFTISADPGTPMPLNSSIYIFKNDKDHTKSFGEIQFTKPGTYTYTITETEGDDDDIIYDTEPHKITIEVVDDGNGKLVAKSGSALIQKIKITNSYDPEKEKKVKTGDDNNLMAWITLMLLATAGIGAAAVYRRKRREDQ